MFRGFFVLGALILGLFLTACDNKEISEIAEAQHCLDKATKTTASACLSKVSGESSQAYMVRCSARFIMEGFTTSRFVKAFENISDDNGSGDATVKALAIFKFNLRTDMDQTLNDCNKSGSLGMAQLAKLADVATFVVTDMGAGALDGIIDEDTGEIDPAKLNDLKTNVLNDASNDEELGEKAVELSEVMCTVGKADTTLCEDLDEAINELGLPPNATQEQINEAIGAKLRDLLKS